MLKNRKPRIVFMGTPHFAVPSLELLIKRGYSLPAVVTAPDKPAGRGRRLCEPPVKLFARESGIPVLQPARLKDPGFIASLKEADPDIIAVVAFRMLPVEVWSIPPLGCINLHASLLPSYRGAAPVNHAIMNGEKVTGVTTFLIEKEIDTGKILLQRETGIEPQETAGELHDRLMVEGARLLEETIEGVLNDKLTPLPQDQLFPRTGKELPSAPRIHKNDCRIDWTRDSVEVFNLIRGLSPYPAAWTMLFEKGDEKCSLKILAADKVRKEYCKKPGKIHTDNETFIHVDCGSDAIEIKSLQFAGRKRLGAADFLRGYSFDESACFV